MTADTETQSDELRELATQAAEQAGAAPEVSGEAPRIQTIAVSWGGATYMVRKDVMEDAEVIEWLGDLDTEPESNFYLTTFIVRRILGRKQYAGLKDQLRDESTDAVDMEQMMNFMNHVWELLGAEK